MVTIRQEQQRDIEAIRNLNEIAFDGPTEADVVDKLRRICDECLSIVAVDDDEVVGHIMFSPATVENSGGVVQGMGLAPMAVLPQFQKQGIGGKLVKEGLKRAKELGYNSVIVIGHKDYYPRFGFQRASKWNIKCPFEVPDEAFMATELTVGTLKNISGMVKFPKEFEMEQ